MSLEPAEDARQRPSNSPPQRRQSTLSYPPHLTLATTNEMDPEAEDVSHSMDHQGLPAVQGLPIRPGGMARSHIGQGNGELLLHEGCTLWGGRVVIPPRGGDFIFMELQGDTLECLESKNLSRMKALARNII